MVVLGAKSYWSEHSFGTTGSGEASILVTYVPFPLARRVEFIHIVNNFGREDFVGEKDVQVLVDDDFIRGSVLVCCPIYGSCVLSECCLSMDMVTIK